MTADYLSKEQTLRFKGILCLIVVFAHCNDSFLYAYGVWAVGVFFFLSGYALGLTTKDKPITPGLVLHKFKNFLLPFALIAVPYHIMFHFYPCIYEYNTLRGALKGLVTFVPTVQAGWYIVSLTYLFIVYFVARKLSKGNNILLFVIMTALYIVYVVYDLVFVHADWPVQNAHMFIVGVLFSMYRENFEKFFKGKTVLGYTLLFVSYLSVVTPVFCFEKGRFLTNAAMFVFYNLSVVLFLYFAFRTRLKGPVTAFFGKYSLWIYLIHVGVQYMLMNVMPMWGIVIRWTVPAFFAATLAVSIVLALAVAVPYNLIMKKS